MLKYATSLMFAKAYDGTLKDYVLTNGSNKDKELAKLLENGTNSDIESSELIFWNGTLYCNGATTGEIEIKETTNGVKPGIYYIASNVTDIKNNINNYVPNNICTSHLVYMGYLFQDNTSFNKDISSWDTSNVTNMTRMFNGASSFNQPLNFDTSNVTDMNYMFYQASSFNQDISSWCVNKIPLAPIFDLGSGFQGQDDLQPKWGTCP